MNLIDPEHVIGWIPPTDSGLCQPIFGSGIIPPRVPLPGFMKGGPIVVTDELAETSIIEHLISTVNEKLRLEDERMRRLLPELPAGYSWHGEIVSSHHEDFASMTGETTMKIVYRLHGPDGEPVERRPR